MQIKLSEEQINMILDYDLTRSITSACNLTLSLVNQVSETCAKEMEYMKLRNKKTGEIGEPRVAYQEIYVDTTEHKTYCYKSIAELNEDWEDYKPSEPLIKDEKIRKAVRAWAEINDLYGVTYSERPNGCAFIFEHVDGDKIVICFRSTWLGLEKGRSYGITELCGEEE